MIKFPKFPFTDMQQLNLDWIMEQLHKMLQFMPIDGVSGDVLQRTVDGAAWQPVSAVSMDIHGLDQLTDPVDGADELPIYDNSAQGNYKVGVSDLMLQAPVQSVNGQTGDVVLSIPSVPVTSVNGQTGDVVLSIPSATSDLVNDSGFVDAVGAAAAAPVQSVNGQTGAVVLSIPDSTSDLVNDSGFVDTAGAAAASPVQSVNGQTGAVVVGDSLSFGTTSPFTVTVYAGIGVLNDSKLWYRISSDGKFIIVWGWISLTFNLTADITRLLLSGPSITGHSDNLSYANCTVLCFNSSGNIDFPVTSNSGFRRLGNVLEILISDDVASTGAMKVVLPAQIFPLDA